MLQTNKTFRQWENHFGYHPSPQGKTRFPSLVMPRIFNVTLIQPAGYAHAMALYEIGLLLQHSLQSLGFACSYQLNRVEALATNIILGYQMLDSPASIPDCDFIIYQLEQLSAREGWFQPRLTEFFRAANEVWDYSLENIDFLRQHGVENVKHLPLGFHEKLQVITSNSCDIDVLFYGSMNERRANVLQALSQDFRVEHLFGVYGVERDRYIARSKVVLNVHFYDAQIMEQPRVAYLMNNRRFVLSEASPINPYATGMCVAAYEQLVSATRYWLEHPAEREVAAHRGYEFLRRHPMTEYLRHVLSIPPHP